MSERTARIRQAVSAPGADVESDPSVESTGTVDFISRRVQVESNLEGQVAALLARLGNTDVADDALETSRVAAVFIDDDVYDLGAGGRWFRSKVEWWQRPLWSLDALQAAGSGWSSGEAAELRGTQTSSLFGSIERERLKQIDPYWHKLFGRRAKDDLPARVWLDPDGRAMRIAWTLPPSQLRRREQPSWTITEFWDWGLPVTIAAPT